jgi:4-diphosphocytidyl-2-C-methyl-D-erythritol kinase
MNAIEIAAFAKINVGLEVFERKSTGYHDIESIFQNVSLADSLRLCRNGHGSIIVEGEFGCPPNESSVYHAAMAFDAACGGLVCKEGISIYVKKGIPAGAGLGGAGSDAAATLWGLNELFGARFTRDELTRLGGRVASDVPFFLFGGAAIVRGRGERVSPILPRTDFGLVVLQPPWTSQTPEAYMALDSLHEEKSVPSVRLSALSDVSYTLCVPDNELESWYRSPIAQWPFKNDFQPVLVRRHPSYQELFSLLEGHGAAYVSLTGSGSCVFGAFESFDHAREAAGKLADNQCSTINIFAVQPLARSMNVRYIQDCNQDTRSDKERPCYGSD